MVDICGFAQDWTPNAFVEETVADLKSLAEKLNLRPAEFIRKSALKELNLKDQLDDDEIYRQIEANPKLMERPIIVKGDKAVIGRPPENLLKII